jgi:lysophospholipase L1-like esterase
MAMLCDPMTANSLTFGAIRKSLSVCVVVQCCLTLAPSQCLAAEDLVAAIACYLHDGDRVVFYGDSITEQANYTLPVETFVSTRCPDLNVTFSNSGWSGDRAWGGEGGTLEERLQRDVIPHRPTVVTVMLGMNDGYYMNFDPKASAAFKESLEKLIDTLEHALPGVRITLIGTSPYDDVTPGEQPDWEKSIQGGYNLVVVRFSVATREVAEKHHLLFVDMNAPLVQLLTQLQATNPKLARQLISDRIHPGSAAGLLMAARLLTAWNIPTSAHIASVNATGTPGRLVRVRQVLPLPFPIDRKDPLTKLVSETSPDLRPFTDDTLRITDLPFANATVEIDGQEIGVYSAEQLAASIDLSALETPLVRRATEVAKMIQLRNRLQHIEWRNLVVPFRDEPPPSVKQAVASLGTTEQDLAALEQASARPALHVIEIVATEN